MAIFSATHKALHSSCMLHFALLELAQPLNFFVHVVPAGVVVSNPVHVL
jgi:hypothetical protein